MKRALPFFVLLFAIASLGGDCEGDVVRDPTFRDWCGDSLCAWRLDAGHIRKAATWHPEDFGVEFLDTPTRISQPSDTSSHCLLFTTVADVDASAQASIIADFDDDGTNDVTLPIAATTWHKVEVLISAPKAYSGVRFTIEKAGSGHAVLAEMRIQTSDKCAGDGPKLHDLPLGATCAADDECGSHSCEAAPTSVCSECGPTLACAGGAACTRHRSDMLGLPLQCGAGRGLGAAGAPCLDGTDCASGTCDGARVRAKFRGDAQDFAACDLGAAQLPPDCAEVVADAGRCR